MRSRIVTLLLALAVGLGARAATTFTHEPSAKSYKNCTKLTKVYEHGVGRPRAKDKTSTSPLRTSRRAEALHRANKHLDRDGDGIACERH